MYCQAAVESEHKQWLQSRVGASDTVDSAEKVDPRMEDRHPFSRAAVLQHLDKVHHALTQAAQSLSNDDETKSLAEVVDNAGARVLELKREFVVAERPDVPKLEAALTDIEAEIQIALELDMSEEVIARAGREIDAQLNEYRRQMQPDAYAQTFNTMLKRRLLELTGIPRLSLFYIR